MEPFYITPKIPQSETSDPLPPPPIKTHKSINGTTTTVKQRQTPPAYKECLKNHAASIGGHALDGCGEFMPSPTATASDPSSLTCAACDCHRNFHRRVAEDPSPPIMAQPLRSTKSAPQMLLGPRSGGSPRKKRVRTRFSQEQKEKMYGVSEKLGWRLCKGDEALVEDFCNQVGIGKAVLKVWMHNNKHTFAKIRDTTDATANTANGAAHHHHHQGGYTGNSAHFHDGSSSSS